MVPYDSDLDMMIDEKYWNSELFDSILMSLEEDYGHQIHRIFQNTQMHIYYSKLNRNLIDIWPYKILSHDGQQELYLYHKDYVRQSYVDVFPFRLVNYTGFETYLPRDPLAYVKRQYGRHAVEEEKLCKQVVEDKCFDDEEVLKTVL